MQKVVILNDTSEREINDNLKYLLSNGKKVTDIQYSTCPNTCGGINNVMIIYE